MIYRLCIVSAEFYPDIARLLEQGAEKAIEKQPDAQLVALHRVPGALEIPTALVLLSDASVADGFVALGCVIRGETSHYDIVAEHSARGLMKLSLARPPILTGNGILTVETHAQALVRAHPDRMDKGGQAAKTVCALLRLRQQLLPQLPQ